MKTTSTVEPCASLPFAVWAAVLAGVATAGCFSTVDPPDLKCSTQKGCPQGYVCRAPKCELAGPDAGVDNARPGPVDGPVGEAMDVPPGLDVSIADAEGRTGLDGRPPEGEVGTASYDSALDGSKSDGAGEPVADAPITWQDPEVLDAARDPSEAGNADGAGGVCSVGATQACTTSSPGACAAGRKTCVRSADSGAVSWGPCEPPSPGKPDCRGTADNNCNGVPDDQEPVCTTCIVGTLEACSTGKYGICASGTHSCAYTADYSAVGWGTCLGASPGAKDCCHAADNDCNGTPDNQEAPCTTCVVNSTRTCNTHVQDGIGLCRAGSQTCVQATDCSDSHWTDCSGDVPPSSIEACGPQAPDANCNEIPGDGEGTDCVTTASVAGKTVKLFKTQVAGTEPVLECVGKCTSTYQAFGSCASQIRVLGYAAAQPAAKYDSIIVPAKTCSISCGCTTCSYTDPGSGPFYVLPDLLP